MLILIQNSKQERKEEIQMKMCVPQKVINRLLCFDQVSFPEGVATSLQQ